MAAGSAAHAKCPTVIISGNCDDGEGADRFTAERDWIKGHFPDLEVSATVEAGDPVIVLRKKSRTAQLTAVGTRGLGGLKSTMLGSVSRGLLLRAEVHVMVVPQPQEA